MTTNYDKIKKMSIEEMAILIVRFNDRLCREYCKLNRQKICDGGIAECLIGIKQWLQAESEE